MTNTRTTIGLVATGLWMLVGSALCYWKWDIALQMRPNEWGDFLSGFLAPLAFLWLILGYLQQGDELRLNTRALRLQQKELKNQVKETRALVREAANQAKAANDLFILEREQVTEADLRSRPFFMWVATENESSYQVFRFKNSGGPAHHVEPVLTLADISKAVTPQQVQFGAIHYAAGAVGKLRVQGLMDYPAVLAVQYTTESGKVQILRLEFDREGHFRQLRPNTKAAETQ